jgi:tRNA A-37 threonylcarbamoyl transferase component Bud32
MTEPTQPRQLEEISVAWLNAQLRQRDVISTQCITHFEATPISNQGMTSLIHLLDLHYDNKPKSAPSRLIAKFSLDNELVKQAFAENRGFEREVNFYQHFSHKAGIPVPYCYWANYSAEDNSCGLLIEYVENTRATTQFNGSIEEIEKVVQYLAPFHARWWSRLNENAPLYHGQAPFMLDMLVEKLKPALENIRENYRQQVGPILIELIQLWIDKAHYFAAADRCHPQTLCHGDLHREQILFPTENSGKFCFIDWQLCAFDTGPTDLAHLLTSGIRPEQHHLCEGELIERYYEGLYQHGVTDYSREQMMTSYQLGIARLVLFYLSAFSLGDMAPVIEWWNTDQKRNGYSFWEVNCQWPSQVLEKHRVLENMKNL